MELTLRTVDATLCRPPDGRFDSSTSFSLGNTLTGLDANEAGISLVAVSEFTGVADLANNVDTVDLRCSDSPPRLARGTVALELESARIYLVGSADSLLADNVVDSPASLTFVKLNSSRRVTWVPGETSLSG